MYIIRKINQKIKNVGVRNAVAEYIYRVLRINTYKESVDTLFYFLNIYAPASNAPKATGALRDLQMCDLQLLKIFDFICNTNQWEYWLDYGTLLGAVRHRGFIPWDDDLDVAMPREAYNKMIEKLPDLAKKVGLEVHCDSSDSMRRVGMGYRHNETGIWLDIFPVDRILSNLTEEQLIKKIREYKHYYLRHSAGTKENINQKKQKLLQSCENGKTRIFHGPEFMYPICPIYEYSDIYPLQKIEFEDYTFWAPNDVIGYIEKLYGKDYMLYPKTGVEHHGGIDKLSKRASNHDVEMSEVNRALEDIIRRMINKCI